MDSADTTTTERPLEAVPVDSAPLAVSTASKTKKGVISLKFAKAPGIPPVECTGIKVTIPVGATATDLTSNPGSIDPGHSSSKGTWTINASPDKATYTCTPPAPARKFVFDEEAQFTLILRSIPVSRLPGQATLSIDATVTTTDTLTEEDWNVQITKSIDDFFFFRSFSCVEPRISNPGTATLRWEGSEAGTEYYLSYDSHVGDDAIPVSGQSCQVRDLTDTTTFVLDARTPDPDEPDGEPGHHYLSATVTVEKPTIHAKSLTATDKIAVADTFTADSSDKTTTAKGPTFFEGDVTIVPNHNLTVGGAATVGSLNARQRRDQNEGRRHRRQPQRRQRRR